MSEIKDNSIDAVVTDPPWALRFMQKKWDYELPSTEIWREVMRVLKPGGHALICCGTRTQHRMVVNVEDAGFEVRDICLHIFGSGFPKSHNISVAIDKLYGAEREVLGTRDVGPDMRGGNFENAEGRMIAAVTAPSTPDAIKWQGWGSALKPAVELWTLVRKPLSEPSIAANVLKWGTGGLNIDASRIGTELVEQGRKGRTSNMANGLTLNKFGGQDYIKPDAQGRFPANLILGCACESEVHEPDCPVRLLDEQSGVSKSVGGAFKNKSNIMQSTLDNKTGNSVKGNPGFGDTGGASRFFYVAKASKAQRNAGLDCSCTHPTVKPIRLMEYLIRLITPPGGRVLDPFAGSGSTLVAAKRLGFEFIGIEIDAEYVAIAEKRVAAAECV